MHPLQVRDVVLLNIIVYVQYIQCVKVNISFLSQRKDMHPLQVRDVVLLNST